MQIFVRLPAGKTITLGVEATDTIGNVKVLLTEETAIQPANQILFYKANLLDDANTLSSYNIKHHEVVEVIFQDSKDKRKYVVAAYMHMSSSYFCCEEVTNSFIQIFVKLAD